MKINLFLIILVCLMSCQSSNNTSNSPAAADTIARVGNTRDNNGCVTTAGYTWSQLKKDCIRPFEVGVTLEILNTANTYQTAAHILIDSTQKKAEIFVPDEDDSIILEQSTDSTFTNGKFNLTRENYCWTLSLNTIKLFQERQ
jgi:hypothetical protein